MDTVHSLSRYQFLQPKLPVWIGGRLSLQAERLHLLHARGALSLHGPEISGGDRPDSLCSGDQVRVWVIEDLGAKGLRFERIERLAAGEWSSTPSHAATSADFAHFVRTVREFFVQQKLDEIFTPSLVPCPGLEPSLEAFAVQVAQGREVREVYLPTSPEIHLKKALAEDWTDIFEIKTCFRKGEFSPHHENEFLMLEWYRSFADLASIKADLQNLLRYLQQAGFCGPLTLQETTFTQLFLEVLQFELSAQTTRSELQALCERLLIHHVAGDSFNDLFHRLWIERIEPGLAVRGPLIVKDFPPSQAALARLTKEGWADRFEFYFQGLEIANAFNEVTDPEEQLQRWHKEQEERRHLGTSALPQDPGLITALRRGLPPTGGIALGVERLYMACRGVQDIRQLREFATDDLFSRR
jgi:lysyl-tRNA synthetase class 2